MKTSRVHTFAEANQPPLFQPSLIQYQTQYPNLYHYTFETTQIA